MAAAKQKTLTKCDATSKVRLGLGDDETDTADVSCQLRLFSTLNTEAPMFSSGVSMRVHLPEGSIVAGPDAAKAMARKEAAAILRKAAGQILKGK